MSSENDVAFTLTDFGLLQSQSEANLKIPSHGLFKGSRELERTSLLESCKELSTGLLCQGKLVTSVARVPLHISGGF